MNRNTLVAIALIVVLSTGCGVEVATTAATSGKLQASQAEQARAQAEKLKAGIADAMQRTEAAASAAGNP